MREIRGPSSKGEKTLEGWHLKERFAHGSLSLSGTFSLFEDWIVIL